jgi:hypothetical protein
MSMPIGLSNTPPMEKNEWLVARIEYFTQVCSDELYTCKQRFDEFSQGYLSDIVNMLIGILVVLGILTTVAIGLQTFELIKNNMLSIVILEITGSVSLIALIYSRHKASTYFAEIDDAYLEIINRINALKGFFAKKSLDTAITSNKFDYLFKYAQFITGNREELFYSYRRAANSILFCRRKDFLIGSVKSESKVIIQAYELYNQYKNALEKENEFFSNIKDLIKPLAEYEQLPTDITNAS